MRPLARLAFLALFATLLGLPAARAQTPAAEPAQESQSAPALPSQEERIERLERFRAHTDQDLALPETPEAERLTKETAAHYQETLRAYYRYRQRGYEHRLAVFEWQFITTKVTFVVVLILVFAGIYFAAIQFHHGLRQTKAGGEQASEATEFVFSFKEFKVRSPVLGVIVLTLSLAFFYLYLVYVYPIENVF